MQAIVTRFLGPTDTRGDRIVVKCDAKRKVIPWNYGLDPRDNHVEAVRVLLAELEWGGTWVLGGMPQKGNTFAYVAVCVTREGPLKVSR